MYMPISVQEPRTMWRRQASAESITRIVALDQPRATSNGESWAAATTPTSVIAGRRMAQWQLLAVVVAAMASLHSLTSSQDQFDQEPSFFHEPVNTTTRVAKGRWLLWGPCLCTNVPGREATICFGWFRQAGCPWCHQLCKHSQSVLSKQGRFREQSRWSSWRLAMNSTYLRRSTTRRRRAGPATSRGVLDTRGVAVLWYGWLPASWRRSPASFGALAHTALARPRFSSTECSEVQVMQRVGRPVVRSLPCAGSRPSQFPRRSLVVNVWMETYLCTVARVLYRYTLQGGKKQETDKQAAAASWTVSSKCS